MEQTTEKNESAIGNFLNPRSVLTPGVAGAFTMMITNAVAANFGLPPFYSALAISALLALVVFLRAKRDHWYQRVLCMVLNSAVIFAIAVGTNQAGLAVTKSAQPVNVGAQHTTGAARARATPLLIATVQPKAPFFSNWLDGMAD
jgi:hypothetical protein